MNSMNEFYEDDEAVADIIKAWNEGQKGITAPYHFAIPCPTFTGNTPIIRNVSTFSMGITTSVTPTQTVVARVA